MTTPKPDPTRYDAVCVDAEHAWVAGVCAGDAAAFERIFRAYNRQLYRFALSLLGSPDEAEDVVQAVFVAIWEHREAWSVRHSLRVYLFTAVRNRVFQQLRGVRTRDRLHGDVVAFGARFRGEASPAPDAQVQQDEFASALEVAIANLPPRAREAFLLTREHGMTYGEAAVTMGVSAKTIMTHIGRALTTLRKAAGPFLALLAVLR